VIFKGPERVASRPATVERTVAEGALPDRELVGPRRDRETPTRLQWPIGDGLGLRPSSLEARRALAAVTNAGINLDQALAMVEMLIAIGPEVRERETLRQTLRELENLEDELDKSVSELLRACRAVRSDGAG
jgi:hypothetical protein